MYEKILLVEDENNVAQTLVDRLAREGYDVSLAKNCEEATLEFQLRRFHLAILDVGLPDGSGFDLAHQIRQESRSTGIIFLTAFGNSEDRVRGLELGAEDYVVKPFHYKELLLRIQNGLKRAHLFSGLGQNDKVQIGRASIDFSKFQAQVDGKEIQLTQKECSLLRLLLDREGRTVSRDEILNYVWSEDEFPTPRTIDNFVMRLRRLVELNPESPQIIRSIRGVGYQLRISGADLKEEKEKNSLKSFE